MLLAIVKSVSSLAVEVGVPQLEIFVLLGESAELVLQSDHLGVEDASRCYFVFYQLLNLDVFTVADAF
jgi:hypothetical protein